MSLCDSNSTVWIVHLPNVSALQLVLLLVHWLQFSHAGSALSFGAPLQRWDSSLAQQHRGGAHTPFTLGLKAKCRAGCITEIEEIPLQEQGLF